MKVSAKQLTQFNQAAELFISKNDDKTKFVYALKKVQKRAIESLEQYIEDRSDLQIKYANVDKNGSVLYSEDGNKYLYTKEDLAALNKELRSLHNSVQYEIEPFISTDVPKDLDEDFKDFFTGFVIKKTDK